MSIVDYQWESGKDDPGTPNISGLEQLGQIDLNTDCVERTTRIDDCTHEITISYSRAGSKAKKQRSTAPPLILSFVNLVK